MLGNPKQHRSQVAIPLSSWYFWLQQPTIAGHSYSIPVQASYCNGATATLSKEL